MHDGNKYVVDRWWQTANKFQQRHNYNNHKRNDVGYSSFMELHNQYKYKIDTFDENRMQAMVNLVLYISTELAFVEWIFIKCLALWMVVH